jgi:hypothetical protein
MAFTVEQLRELTELRAVAKHARDTEARLDALHDQLQEHLEDRGLDAMDLHGVRVEVKLGPAVVDWRQIHVEKYGEKKTRRLERHALRRPLVVIDGSPD